VEKSASQIDISKSDRHPLRVLSGSLSPSRVGGRGPRRTIPTAPTVPSVPASSAAGLREHSLGGVVNEWLLTLKVEGRSPRTLKWYRQQIDMYRRRGGVERLADLTGGELRRYIGELQDSGRADNTVRGAFLSLKCMCNWAAREGYAVDPALLRVKTPRVAEKELFTYRADQVKAILDAASEVWGAENTSGGSGQSLAGTKQATKASFAAHGA